MSVRSYISPLLKKHASGLGSVVKSIDVIDETINLTTDSITSIASVALGAGVWLLALQSKFIFKEALIYGLELQLNSVSEENVNLVYSKGIQSGFSSVSKISENVAQYDTVLVTLSKHTVLEYVVSGSFENNIYVGIPNSVNQCYIIATKLA